MRIVQFVGDGFAVEFYGIRVRGMGGVDGGKSAGIGIGHACYGWKRAIGEIRGVWRRNNFMMFWLPYLARYFAVFSISDIA